MKRIMFLLILAIFATSASGDAIFSDDFESGTLDNWTIGGRQQGGVNIAEVVDRHGSQMAHVHHSETSTEITIEKIFDYDAGLEFSFDMEVSVASDAGPTDDDYARGGSHFVFYDSSEESIGHVAYVLSTSSLLFDWDDSDPTLHYSDIGDGSLTSYTLSIQDILSNIDVEPSSIDSVNFSFMAYNSGFGHNMSADVWVDNVTVVCELPTLEEIEIIGPNEVAENFSAGYKAIAHYESGSTKDVTDSAEWLVEPNSVASIEAGLLTTEGIDRPEEYITIYAQYTEGNVTVEAEKEVLVFTICPSGSALSFDGVDDYVDTNSADLNLKSSDTITVCAWIRPKVQKGDSGHIVSDYDKSNTIGWMTDFSPDNTFRVTNIDFTKSRKRQSSALALNQWHHVVAIIYPTDYPDIYVNGLFDNNYSPSGDPTTQLYMGSGNVLIGRQSKYSTPERHFNGTIDEVAIYNRALSAEEIRANMHTRLNGDEPGLVGYWDFDEGEGQIAYDLSGNGNHGQLGSTPNADASDPAWIESDAPIGICTLEGLVERDLSDVLDIKLDILEQLGIALAKEEAVVDMLNTFFKNRDFGSAKKKDVGKAKKKIHSAIKHEKKSKKELEKSIEKLEDALATLGQ